MATTIDEDEDGERHITKGQTTHEQPNACRSYNLVANILARWRVRFQQAEYPEPDDAENPA